MRWRLLEAVDERVRAMEYAYTTVPDRFIGCTGA
jgi:hypothetical protein